MKLSLVLKESTTVFLGYGLGDFNVLTAVDWAKNIFENNCTEYPHYLIQVLYIKDNPNQNPYHDDNGVIIIETNDLNNFMKEICGFYEEELYYYQETIKQINCFENKLNGASQSDIENFIDDDNYRRNILDEFRSLVLMVLLHF